MLKVMSPHSRFELELVKFLEDKYNEIQISFTNGFRTLDEYKSREGYLRALNDVNNYREDINKKIDKGE